MGLLGCAGDYLSLDGPGVELVYADPSLDSVFSAQLSLGWANCAGDCLSLDCPVDTAVAVEVDTVRATGSWT